MSQIVDVPISLDNVRAVWQETKGLYATWSALGGKQEALTAAQLTAANSGVTAAHVTLIAQNTSDIASLQSLVTARVTLRKVSSLPTTGEENVIYLVPDAGADEDDPDQCTEYLWTDSRWEVVGKTSVTPGDGTLTINVNGQSAGTFSADQSTDTTISLTIPLAVSDLQNDEDFQTADEVDSTVSAAVTTLSDSLADVAFSGSFDDLSDVPSGLDIGNGRLTINRNGTAVATFEANQKLDATANIVVPTAVSDLSDASAYAQLAGANSWTGSNAFTQPIQGDLTGTAAQATADADGNTITTTYATQTALATVSAQVSTNTATIADKADDADVVHLDGAETITGAKTFGAQCTMSGAYNFVWAQPGLTLGTYPSGAVFYQQTVSRDSAANTLQMDRGYVDSSGYNHYTWTLYNFDDRTGSCGIHLLIDASGANKQLRPLTNGDTSLGTAGRKWSTLNGINPGDLSLPSSSYVDIDTSTWATGSANQVLINSASPTYPGVLFIQLATYSATLLVRLFSTSGGTLSYVGIPHQTAACMVAVPCPANTAIYVYVSELPAYCRYYAILGNV